jgi:hypothetical protein
MAIALNESCGDFTAIQEPLEDKGLSGNFGSQLGLNDTFLRWAWRERRNILWLVG